MSTENKCCFCGRPFSDAKTHLFDFHETLIGSIRSSRNLGYEFGHKLGGWDICKCKCHSPGSTMDHCMPCCYPCSFCKQVFDGIQGAPDHHIFDEHPEAWEPLKDLLEELTRPSGNIMEYQSKPHEEKEFRIEAGLDVPEPLQQCVDTIAQMLKKGQPLTSIRLEQKPVEAVTMGEMNFVVLEFSSAQKSKKNRDPHGRRICEL